MTASLRWKQKMSQTVNLAIDQGANFVAEVTVTDWNADVFDLSNCSAITGEIRRSYYTANAAATFECTITDAANGVFQIELTGDDTADLESNQRYVYDIVGEFVDGTRARFFEGLVMMNGNTTRFV